MKQLLSIIFLFIYPLFLFSQDDCTDLNEDAICDEIQIVGCTNPEACNFNADAQFSDLFSCIYSEECSEADSCIGIYDEETESCNSNLITVRVIKVHDITCNGEFDAGESYLDGWDFQYMTGNYSGTVTTNSTGVGFIYLPLSETNITIWEEPFDYSNSFVGYEPYGGQYSYDIDLSSGDSSYTLYFYNCPCTMLEGYKYLDNDCNCEFSDGDTTLSDWPIIISAGYIGPTWQGPPGYIATMDTIYTDSDGKWSYCISSQDLLEATNFQNVEYFSVSEGMLPGYYACEEVIYEQKLYGSTGLQANIGNPLTGGIYDAIPIGSKFSFFNCPEPATSIYVDVYGCKIEDVDCDGVFTQGIDNYLPGWTINWDTGYEMGSVVTDQEGCYELQIPIPSDFIGEITLSENMQNGYIPWGDNDMQTISVGEDEPIFEVNFFNCPEQTYVSVSGCKIEDVDCDGVFTEGIDNYLPGWTINWDNGYEMGYVLTDENGCYSIDVPLSTNSEGDELFSVTIFEDVQNGYSAFDGNDSETIIIDLDAPESYLVNFFNCPQDDSVICGYKYIDVNCNCVFDDGDYPYENWPIHLYAVGSCPYPIIHTTYTDEDGYYCIDLDQVTNDGWTYWLSEEYIPGYETCEEGPYPNWLPTCFETNATFYQIVNVANTSNYNSEYISIETPYPWDNGQLIDQDSSYNFFNCITPCIEIIGGNKIIDNDCNCEITDGDILGIGWEINLVDADGNVVMSTITSEEGWYYFEVPCDLLEELNANGGFSIVEVAQPGFNSCNSSPQQYDLQFSMTSVVPPLDGELLMQDSNGTWNLVNPDFDFHFYNCPDIPVEATITICKVEDINCDGIFTQGVDNYLSGWEIDWETANLGSGTVVTEDNGCVTMTIELTDDFEGLITFSEQMQQGYFAFDEMDIQTLEIDPNNSAWYNLNFYNCSESGCPSLPAECIIDGALNISTGYDNSINTLMPTTNLSANQIVSDPYWILIGSPDPSVLTGGPANVIPPYSSAWETSSLSQYISAYTIAANQVTPQIQGGAIIEDPYKFQNCFCVCEGGEVYIDLGVSSDNYAELYLIKDADSATPTTVLIGSTPGPVGNYYTTQNFNNFWPMDYSGNLDPGTHCLEAHLWNQDSGQGMGLNVQGTVSTANGALEDYLCCAGQSYISGTKYIDQDCDGLNFSLNSLLSPDTNGGSGWEITLYDDNNNIISTTITDNNGYYNFVIDGDESPSGTYVISETQQNGFSSSLETQTITNFGLNGYEAITVDFINCPDPFVPIDSVTVCVYKIIDNDCDGIFSIGDEYGTGWHMAAAGYGDGYTNGDAGWCFEVSLSSIDPNNPYITISEDVVDCYTSNPSAFQDLYIDPYNDANYSAYFYNCPDPIKIEGYKIIDEDGDGVFTQGVDTYGIGWDIYLESNGFNSSYYDQTSTDNNGYYSFEIPSNLDISEFLVWEAQQDGFNSCSEDSVYVQGLDTCHYEISFFNCPIQTYTVIVEKVVDWDCNGEFGSGDELLDGWEIFWESNNYSGSVITDANGQATIELPITEQQIVVWEDSNNSVFTNGAYYDYEVFGDDYEYLINFDPDLNGYDYSYTFYNCPCKIIDGYKYLDNDCNCEFTDGDSVLEDWPIIISAGYITQNTGPGQPGFTATMDTVYTDSQGYWSYCISQQGILNATNGQNPEYFSVSEGMLPGYYACEEVVYEQKLFGPTGLQANTGNPLTGGDYAPIPDGSKFSFFNCPDQPSTVTVTGCKIEDVDCDGIFTQGIDNYLPGWTINWDNGYEMGYMQTDSTGCYIVEVPIPSDFGGTIIMTENMQDGYIAWQGNDEQVIEVDFDMEDPYTINFFNCPTNTCVEIVEYNMDCQDDIFYLDLVLENTTNLFDFSQYTLVPMDPELTSSPSYFDNTWNIGNTNTFSLEIFNVTDHESICFFFSAFNCLADEDCEDCCSEVLCFDVLPCPESSLFDFDLNGYFVYPNPVRDKFIIQSELPTDYTYTVYDSFGKKIITNTGNGKETIQSLKWSNGIYMLVIEDEDSLPKQYKIIVHN